MSHLTPADLAAIKDKLLAEKKDLEDELGSFAVKDEKIKGNYTTPYVDIGTGEDDNSFEYTEQEKKLSLEHTLEESLKDTNKALQRLEEDSYGLCKYCQEPIPKERLLARPQASSCIKCKSVLKGARA